MASRRAEEPGRYRKEKEKKFDIRQCFAFGGYYDFALIFLIVFLVALGLVMVYSTSSYTAQLNYGDSYYFLKRQLAASFVGFLAMGAISNLNYNFLRAISPILMAAIIILLVVVLLWGVASHGASRWLNVFGVSLQPSEFAKIIIILFVAHAATNWAARLGDFKIVCKVVFFPLVAIILIAKENLSTAIICTAITAVIIFVTTPKLKTFLAMAGIAVLGGLFFLVIASYRLERIKVWLHPEDYDKGYQTLQALYAVGSGGFFGKGLGQSVQKLGFIPESHNDMIFSVICEELGLFGAFCIIMLFVLLIWRCVIIAMSAPDMYASLVVVGVITHIACQVIINIAVVTNFFPPTGVPLPFISFGGTSMLTVLAEMGLVLAVAKQIRIGKNKE